MNSVGVCRKLVAMLVVAVSGVGVLATSSVAPAAGAAARAPAGDAFYVPPKPLAKAKPGTIIRSTPIADVPAGARAWKVLYHSRAVDGRDIAVSGVVVAPTGKAPRGGRVVVTWAVATGLPDVCAPSKQPDIASGTSGAGIGYPRALIPMLQTFLDAGYVVAATDYEGGGTPGPHPALVGESMGRGVLDAARAAHGLKAAAAGNNALVFGLSGGGPGALFAGELAASYAPDLRVLGVTAVAPWTNNEIPFQVLATGSVFNALIVSVVKSFHAAYPEFDPAALLTSDALAKSAVFDQKCDIGPTFANDTEPALAHNPLDTPALATILHTNSAGNRPAGAPLLVVQGTDDQTTLPFLTDAFVAKACGAGDTVDYRLYTGASHGDPELNAASTDIAAWFAERVSGAPATTTCT